MTLPTSGAISLSQVNTELGYSSTAQISMNNSAVRTLFGQSSGPIDMNTGHGKANQFFFNISGGQNLNLRTLATNAGWNQSSQLYATITGNIGSTSTGAYALTINGTYPQGLWVTINSGIYVVGAGGNGGSGGTYGNGGNTGGAGGPSINCSSAVNITNNGVIGGGGGGGGGSASATSGRGDNFGAGGGGGAGYNAGAGGPNVDIYINTAGSPGTLTGGGAGHTGSNAGPGGDGGSLGSSGGQGWSGNYAGGPGGAAGAAVVGSSYINWSNQGTIYGSLS